jgi:hypothetical protein
MNKPTCVWNKKLADMAVQIVLALGTDLIIQGIPGQTFVYMIGEGRNKKPLGSGVSKKRILSVFNWIISQTQGFKVPLLVNFQHGDAPTIALGMIQAFSSSLSEKLDALEKVGLNMPRISFYWHNGPSSPLMLISNLSQTQGKMGLPLDGIKTINIYGVIQQSDRIIRLEKIPQ